MPSRWFNVAVVIFWMTTMGWLFVEKIWPALDPGEPPGYGSLESPVRWELFIGGEPLGWATNQADEDQDGVVAYQYHVHLDHLPLAEVAPAWLLPSLDARLSETSMDIRGTTEVDPLNRLIAFRSTVDLGHLDDVVIVEGNANEASLDVKVRVANLTHEHTMPLPAGSTISGALSPSAHLGGLRVGQHWTLPVVSPFHPPTAPVEILYARVVRDEPIIWNGQVVPARLVTYSREPASASSGHSNWRARAWVAHDGRVLKQQIAVISANVTFIRLPGDVAVDTIQRAAAGTN